MPAVEASPLLTVRDLIVSIWEAVVPADGGRTFKYVGKAGSDFADGIDHRTFEFSPPSGADFGEHNATAIVFEWTFTGHVFLNFSGISVGARFDLVANDAKALVNAVNNAGAGSWPPGCGEIQAQKAEIFELADADAVELVITFRAHTYEK